MLGDISPSSRPILLSYHVLPPRQRIMSLYFTHASRGRLKSHPIDAFLPRVNEGASSDMPTEPPASRIVD